MKKLRMTAIAAVVALGMTLPMAAACNKGVPEYDGTEVQGVSATEILVGNSLAKTGAYATTGIPFEYGMKAAFWQYNQNYTFEFDATNFTTFTKVVTKNAGFGENNLLINYKNYDDEYNGATGAANINRLINDDKVFAIVGHFGTPTVSATMDDIIDKGIPMIYAATGVSDLYNDNAQGYERCVFPVQPIYDTEGKVMLARAFASSTPDAVLGRYNGLNATKVGVIYTTDDAGKGMYNGIKAQAKELPDSIKNNIVYQSAAADAATYTTEINNLQSAGCDVVIIASNQAPFEKIMRAMKERSYNAKCITSYVSNNGDTMGALADEGVITADRPVYSSAWLDNEGTALADYMVMVSTFLAYSGTDVTTAMAYSANSYAMAGYVAATTFIEGLNRVEEAEKELTWLNYIEAMESAPVAVAMSNGSLLDFEDGHRYGTTAMSLSVSDTTAVADGKMTLKKVSGMVTLEDLMKDINENR